MLLICRAIHKQGQKTYLSDQIHLQILLGMIESLQFKLNQPDTIWRTSSLQTGKSTDVLGHIQNFQNFPAEHSVGISTQLDDIWLRKAGYNLPPSQVTFEMGLNFLNCFLVFESQKEIPPWSAILQHISQTRDVIMVCENDFGRRGRVTARKQSDKRQLTVGKQT